MLHSKNMQNESSKMFFKFVNSLCTVSLNTHSFKPSNIRDMNSI